MTRGAFAVTTTAQALLAPGTKWVRLFIQNPSNQDVYFELDTADGTLTTANGLKLATLTEKVIDNPVPRSAAVVSVIHGGSGDKEIRFSAN